MAICGGPELYPLPPLFKRLIMEGNTIHKIPVSLTDGALEEVRRLLTEMQLPEGQGLRLGVTGGGCAGFSYLLDFGGATEKDNVYDLHGITLIIDPAHELYLHGTELDFKRGLDNRGFIFNNPNAEETCGCGSSFGV